MRILIKNGRTIKLCVPTSLLLNRVTAVIAAKGARTHGVTFTGNQLHTFFRALRKFRREHPDWILVSVTDANGDQVEILP